MSSPDLCLVYAPIIGLLVSLLKRVPLVSRYPKVVAAIFSAAATILPTVVTGGALASVPSLLLCFAAQLGLSVGTFEVLRPALRATGIDPTPAPTRRATD